MKSNAVKAWLFILFASLSAYGGYTLRRVYQAQNAPAPPSAPAKPVVDFELPEFTLTDSAGQTFSSRQMRGKPWVISFFFSSCGSVCVNLNNTIADLLKDEFADAPVQFVSVTVDPNKDTPEELAKYKAGYVERFQLDPKRWTFLTTADGDKKPIVELSKALKLAYGRLTHSDRMILIDARGRVQNYYQSSFSADIELLKRKLTKLCGETSQKP